MVDELFVPLGLDKHKWVQHIKRGESLLASFLACIEGMLAVVLTNKAHGKHGSGGVP